MLGGEHTAVIQSAISLAAVLLEKSSTIVSSTNKPKLQGRTLGWNLHRKPAGFRPSSPQSQHSLQTTLQQPCVVWADVACPHMIPATASAAAGEMMATA
jgi:hypothetical protein